MFVVIVLDAATGAFCARGIIRPGLRGVRIGWNSNER
jgi:hypothetical protein